MPPPGTPEHLRQVRLPDTATHAVLIDELFDRDGPHHEYADRWVTLQLGGYVPPMSPFARVISPP